MDPLPDTAVTIAERFKKAGYRTGAVVGSVILTSAPDSTRGSTTTTMTCRQERPRPMALADLQRPATEVTAAAIRMARTAGRGPVVSVGALLRSAPAVRGAGEVQSARARAAPTTPRSPTSTRSSAVYSLKIDPAQTAIVVTADHGEALGDHGEPDHGFFLYDADAARAAHRRRRPDRRAARRSRAGAQHRHRADDRGAGRAAAGAAGETARACVPLIEGRRARRRRSRSAESWYPRLHFGWSELRSARVGEWKYIAAPKPELYDLRTDPGERKNVIGARQSVAGRLSQELTRILKGFAPPSPTPRAQPDAAAVQRLQALGYIGSLGPAPAGTGDDPKRHIQDYVAYRENFNRALSLLGRGSAAEAATVLKQLLRGNVRAFEAHLYLGNAYAARGDAEKALGEYDAAVQLNPELATPHVEACKVLTGLSRYPEATIAAGRGSRSNRIRLRALHARRGLCARRAMEERRRHVHARHDAGPLRASRARRAGAGVAAARRSGHGRGAFRGDDPAAIPGARRAVQPRHHGRAQRRQCRGCPPLSSRACSGPVVRAGA